MTEIDYITQPDDQTTNVAIDKVLSQPGMMQIDVAAAYITSSGVQVLLRTMNERACAQKESITKRWITSFDYCRTDPVALKSLRDLPSSSVRIHDAFTCLASRGAPKVPFHPKAFLFRAQQHDYALTGSGNISRSGLSRGFEAGLVIGIDRTSESVKSSAFAAISALQRWYEVVWQSAVPLSDGLLAQYKSLYESAPNLRNPVPTDDDIATSYTTSGSLTSDNLKKLRVCSHFWIEAGNITRNRGPGLPGNQLMMKRLSRVFFGFAPTAVPKNSFIGQVAISFNQRPEDEYSLTYSDNSMDKLVLPIPGNSGPASYDGCNLVFERIGPRRFLLGLGSDSEKKVWLRRSEAIGGDFKMSSGGRQWGVF